MTAVLVAAASGFCMPDNKPGDTSKHCELKLAGTSLSIDHWWNGTAHKEIKLQYFVFGTAWIFCIISCATIFLACSDIQLSKAKVTKLEVLSSPQSFLKLDLCPGQFCKMITVIIIGYQMTNR